MSTLARVSVLVADSDPGAALLYATALQVPEGIVHQAFDGRDALVKALDAPPSFVITETALPFIDGYSLCQILRTDPVTSNVPILAITADARRTSLDRVLAAGADSALVKPCDPAIVRTAVQRLLGVSRGLRADSEHLLANAAARRARANAVLERSIEQRWLRKNRSHPRYETSEPPMPPRSLHCPLCDHPLTFMSSQIGGVNARWPEQWDRYICSAGCGDFQYRHRTRRLRAV